MFKALALFVVLLVGCGPLVIGGEGPDPGEGGGSPVRAAPLPDAPPGLPEELPGPNTELEDPSDVAGFEVSCEPVPCLEPSWPVDVCPAGWTNAVVSTCSTILEDGPFCRISAFQDWSCATVPAGVDPKPVNVQCCCPLGDCGDGVDYWP